MAQTRTVISLCATTATLLLVAFFVATFRLDARPTADGGTSSSTSIDAGRTLKHQMRPYEPI